MLGKLGAILLESGDLLLDVILEKVTVPLGVASGQPSELGFEKLLVKNLGQSDTASSSLAAIGRPNALSCCSDLALWEV
jgi:hypothetical protein